MATDSHLFSPANTGGILLLLVHTLLVVRTFWYCSVHRAEGQVVLAWMLFFLVDFPSVPLASWLLRGNPFMERLSNWGYQQIGSGPNLCWAVVTTLVGGIHWYLLGRYLGMLLIRFPS